MAPDEKPCLGSLGFLSASFCSLLLDQWPCDVLLRVGCEGFGSRPCSNGMILPKYMPINIC